MYTNAFLPWYQKTWSTITKTGTTYMQWSHNMQISLISVKELFPVVIAADGNPIQGG